MSIVKYNRHKNAKCKTLTVRFMNKTINDKQI